MFRLNSSRLIHGFAFFCTLTALATAEAAKKPNGNILCNRALGDNSRKPLLLSESEANYDDAISRGYQFLFEGQSLRLTGAGIFVVDSLLAAEKVERSFLKMRNHRKIFFNLANDQQSLNRLFKDEDQEYAVNRTHFFIVITHRQLEKLITTSVNDWESSQVEYNRIAQIAHSIVFIQHISDKANPFEKLLNKIPEGLRKLNSLSIWTKRHPEQQDDELPQQKSVSAIKQSPPEKKPKLSKTSENIKYDPSQTSSQQKVRAEKTAGRTESVGNSTQQILKNYYKEFAQFEHSILTSSSPAKVKLKWARMMGIYDSFRKIRKNLYGKKPKIHWLLIFSKDVRDILIRAFPYDIPQSVAAQSARLGSRRILMMKSVLENTTTYEFNPPEQLENPSNSSPSGAQNLLPKQEKLYHEFENIVRNNDEMSFPGMITKNPEVFNWFYILRHSELRETSLDSSHWLLHFSQDVREKLIKIFINEISPEVIEQSRDMGEQRVPF